MDGTALIFCEGAFATPSGKTANGLVRHTERYQVLGVVDSTHAGKDAGEILDGKPVGIPVFASLGIALQKLDEKPDYLVIGLAPDGGILPNHYRKSVSTALRLGINVDAGLHSFLGENEEFIAAAKQGGASIRDVRKPPPRPELHFWSGKINQVKARKVVVLGTDSAIGKRTTALCLLHALQNKRIQAAMIGTGQTSWFQGIPHTVIMDAIVNDFVAGELEHVTWRAWKDLHPEIIIIEAQGCITHPAYPGGFEILGACKPDAIILQHAPKRRFYDGFPGLKIAGLDRELAILKLLSPAPVIAITLNHEQMSRGQVEETVKQYESRYRIPSCDPLLHGCDKLLNALANFLAPD